MPAPCGLFFDGGSRVGWAVMAYAQSFDLIAKGSFATASEGKGLWGWRLHVIDQRVQALIDRYKPARIGFEAPWVPRPKKENTTAVADPMAARFLICVCGVFEMVAARNNYGPHEISEVQNATAKKALTGTARFTDADGRRLSTKEQKAKMIAACHGHGWMAADEHEADAIAVGMVCIDNYLRGRE